MKRSPPDLKRQGGCFDSSPLGLSSHHTTTHHHPCCTHSDSSTRLALTSLHVSMPTSHPLRQSLPLLSVDHPQRTDMKIDPHANEPTAALNPAIHAKYLEAKENADQWKKEADRLRGMLLSEMGDAYAGTVNGFKLITHRPEERFNTTQLRKDYPTLTDQYIEYKTEEVFNAQKFAASHPEIAEVYRTRSFRSLAEPMG